MYIYIYVFIIGKIFNGGKLIKDEINIFYHLQNLHDACLVVDSGGLCPDPGGGPGDQQHHLVQPSYHHRYTISYNSHTIIGIPSHTTLIPS